MSPSGMRLIKSPHLPKAGGGSALGRILWLTLLILAGCSKDPSQPIAAPIDVPKLIASAPTLQAPAGFDWPGVPYTKVIAFQFVPPPGWGQFSVLKDTSIIDADRLSSTARRATPLNQSQTSSLLSAVLKPQQSHRSNACYDPQHVFVFYSAANVPVASLEVCFGCKVAEAIPKLPSLQLPDFTQLAKLTHELSLWEQDEQTVAEYTRELTDRSKPTFK